MLGEDLQTDVSVTLALDLACPGGWYTISEDRQKTQESNNKFSALRISLGCDLSFKVSLQPSLDPGRDQLLLEKVSITSDMQITPHYGEQ